MKLEKQMDLGWLMELIGLMELMELMELIGLMELMELMELIGLMGVWKEKIWELIEQELSFKTNSSPFNSFAMLKSKVYSFETLQVWQESRPLVVKVYQITSKFPAEEKFGLTNQMRRASVSLISNLAEGSSRASFKDQARFSEISFGSLMELLNQFILCFDLLLISEENLNEIRADIDRIGLKLHHLRKSQTRRYKSSRDSKP